MSIGICIAVLLIGCFGISAQANQPTLNAQGDARQTGLSPWNRPVWRVDSGRLTAPPIAPGENGFTVNTRVRLLGQGSQRGNNGATNGTICSQGIGYWNGWRMTVRYPDGTLMFEVGRPAPLGSVSVGSRIPAPQRCWVTLTATWDRREMRLYVDGVLTGLVPYDGAYTDPGDALPQLGYAGYGVGSTLMETDGLTVDTRAWTPEDVWQAAWPEKRLQSAAAAVLNTGPTAEVQTLVRLARDRSLPEWMREWAVRRAMLSAAQGVALTGELAHWLRTRPETTEAERRALSLRVARWMVASRRWKEADRTYTQAVADAGSEEERQSLTLERADMWVAAGLITRAEPLYRGLNRAKSVVVRYEALCGLGRAHLAARRFGASDSALRQAYALNGLPEHLRWEAAEWRRRVARIRSGAPAIDPADWRTPAPPAVKPVYTLYVSPSGSDTAEGSRLHPLATLEAARDRMRDWRRQHRPAGATVIRLLAGEYQRSAPLVLGPQDSGSAEAPVVWMADSAGAAVLTGGVRIGPFKSVSDDEVLERLPEGVRSRVLCARLPDGVSLPPWPQRGFGSDGSPQPDVFHRQIPLQPARWPNTGWVANVSAAAGADGKPVLGFSDVPFDRWSRTSEICLAGYPVWHWADYLGTARILDAKSGMVQLTAAPAYGVKAHQPWYFVNILEEIDTPGEWYIDRENRLLYLLPPKDWAGGVTLTALDTPMIRAAGTRHLRFEGIRFEYGRDCAIDVQDAADLLIYRCDIRCMGGDGLRITGERCAVRSTQISWMGRGGVWLAGGDRRTLTSGGNLVENCHIHHLSRLDRTYTPAVKLDGVGATVRRNLFEQIPSSAMRVEGNDHLVELNVVRDVVTESDDQGGLDMWGDPTYRGNVIRFNRWERIGGGIGPTGQGGVRLDDAISGTLIYGNRFIDCARGLFGGVQLHGGKDNVIDNNSFERCVAGISLSPWGPDHWRQFLTEGDGAKRLKAVDITRPPYSTRYPDLARLLDAPNRHHIWRNSLSAGEIILRDNGIQDAQLNRTELGGWLPGSWQIVPERLMGRYPDTGAITSSPLARRHVTVKGGVIKRPSTRKR